MAIPSLEKVFDLFRKENPAQSEIARDEGHIIYTNSLRTYETAFKNFEVVQRGTSLVVQGAALFDIDVKDEKITEGVKGLRKGRVENLLNYKPNPFQDIQAFRTNIFTDFVIEGNIFMYWDGVHLYHLPADKVEIIPSPVTYVDHYKYGEKKFTAKEIIHIKDLSVDSIYRGTSRLGSSYRSLNVLASMRKFQDDFFSNGAAPGLVLESDNTLSKVAKDRTIQNWIRYK